MSGQRPTLRRGLPYGWWKNPDIWAFCTMLLMIAGLGLGLFMGWFW